MDTEWRCSGQIYTYTGTQGEVPRSRCVTSCKDDVYSSCLPRRDEKTGVQLEGIRRRLGFHLPARASTHVSAVGIPSLGIRVAVLGRYSQLPICKTESTVGRPSLLPRQASSSGLAGSIDAAHECLIVIQLSDARPSPMKPVSSCRRRRRQAECELRDRQSI